MFFNSFKTLYSDCVETKREVYEEPLSGDERMLIDAFFFFN